MAYKNPEYVYVEYPKWVTNRDGEKVVVADADEEKAVTAPRRGRPPKVKNG
jgi:hypothetical protein